LPWNDPPCSRGSRTAPRAIRVLVVFTSSPRRAIVSPSASSLSLRVAGSAADDEVVGIIDDVCVELVPMTMVVAGQEEAPKVAVRQQRRDDYYQRRQTQWDRRRNTCCKCRREATDPACNPVCRERRTSRGKRPGARAPDRAAKWHLPSYPAWQCTGVRESVHPESRCRRRSCNTSPYTANKPCAPRVPGNRLGQAARARRNAPTASPVASRVMFRSGVRASAAHARAQPLPRLCRCGAR